MKKIKNIEEKKNLLNISKRLKLKNRLNKKFLKKNAFFLRKFHINKLFWKNFNQKRFFENLYKKRFFSCLPLSFSFHYNKTSFNLFRTTLMFIDEIFKIEGFYLLAFIMFPYPIILVTEKLIVGTTVICKTTLQGSDFFWHFCQWAETISPVKKRHKKQPTSEQTIYHVESLPTNLPSCIVDNYLNRVSSTQNSFNLY